MSTMTSNSTLEEIRRLHDTGQNGILRLSSAGERVEVSFRDGLIDAVSSNIETYRLGNYLVKSGHLERRDLDTAQSEARREKILLGEATVRRQLLGQIELGATVRQQSIDLLEYALKNDFAIDSFTVLFRSHYVPARISFPHLLLETCRKSDALFEVTPGTKIVLSDESNLAAYPWEPRELSVLLELHTPSTFEGLLSTTKMQQSALKKILGVFATLGVIKIVTPAGVDVEPGITQALVANSDFAFEQLIPVVTNPVLSEKLAVARNESSFTTEQFRTLKVCIRQADATTPLKVLAVSSPEPGDGKSLISANLAFSFAMDPGQRTIIVDCDFRNSSLQKYLGVPAEPGFLQYLTEGNLSPYCFVRRIDNLYFLTTGGIVPNPIEIMSMQKTKQLIERLRRDFDTIILDSPPYTPIADARIVTGFSDALIMVLRRGRTSYASTDRAFKSADRNKLLGVVFNDVQPMLYNTYYQSGYYGKNPYSYGTVQKSPKKYLKS
jgi:capsular exopolysaccharide synthesis family protein